MKSPAVAVLRRLEPPTPSGLVPMAVCLALATNGTKLLPSGSFDRMRRAVDRCCKPQQAPFFLERLARPI